MLVVQHFFWTCSKVTFWPVLISVAKTLRIASFCFSLNGLAGVGGMATLDTRETENEDCTDNPDGPGAAASSGFLAELESRTGTSSCALVATSSCLRLVLSLSSVLSVSAFSSFLGGLLSVEVTLAITLAAFAPTLVKSERTYDLSAVTFQCAITRLTNSASSGFAFSLALVETSLRMST